MDMATSPSKLANSNTVVDPSVRKRLPLEIVNKQRELVPPMVPAGTLTLTQGKGEDGVHNTSPSSSISRKHARTSLEGISGDASAASLEEDRQSQ